MDGCGRQKGREGLVPSQKSSLPPLAARIPASSSLTSRSRASLATVIGRAATSSAKRAARRRAASVALWDGACLSNKEAAARLPAETVRAALDGRWSTMGGVCEEY